MKGTFDNVQTWFAARRVALHKKPHWFSTPPFKARYNDISGDATAGIKARHQGVLNAFMLCSLLVGVGLAAYGWYVLTYIAQ